MRISERKSFLATLGVNESNLAQHANFLSYVWDKNQTDLNIISRKQDINDLIQQHWVDSLLALPFWPSTEGLKIADFGSGGGFPAIPLAIEQKQQRFYLFEKSPKKQKFLNDCIKHLGLDNVQVKGLIEDTNDYDIVTARAFKPIKVILKLSKNHQGKYLLFKARKERIEEEIHDAKNALKNKKVEIIKLNSQSLENERHLVLID